MDIKEIRTLKEQLEQQIFNIIMDFEKITETNIIEINVLTAVKLKIEI